MRYIYKQVWHGGLTIIFLLIYPSFVCSQQSENTHKLSTFLDIAEDLFDKAQLPGAGIALTVNGDIVYTGGFGYRNISTKQEVTENTSFFIGSTTKAFTGYIAARLVEQGLLHWRTPIINYLPTFSLSEPYVANHVNLEDLFTHMTGLAQMDELWHAKNLSREEVYKQAADLPFSTSFREKWGYNNHSYVIIGKVLESVTGKSWESLVETYIFEPLGMDNSTVTYMDFMGSSNRVSSYYGDGKTARAHVNSDNVGPAGAIGSTPNDLAQWIKMLCNKGRFNGDQLISSKEYEYLISPKSMSFIDTCTVQYYSIGWGGLKVGEKRTLRHSGAIAGNNARVSIMPDDGFGIFVTTNQRSDYKDILTDYAERIFVYNDFVRDFDREARMISLNRFMQFQNLLLNNVLEAAKTYHSSLKYREFEPEMLKLGQSLLDAGYLDLALEVYKLNIDDRPKSYLAYDHYADALLKSNNKEKAIEMYEKSIRINPDNLGAEEKLLKVLRE